MFLKKIEQNGKKLLLLVLSLFVKSEELKREDVELDQVGKILIVRQDDRIGNLILTTPLLSAIRKHFPKAEIWYVASKTFHTFFSKSSLVDEILVAKKRQYIFHPLSLVLFIRKIRKQKFDLAFDASDENNFSLNNSFLAYLSGARYKIGHKKAQSHLFLNLEVPSSPASRHASEMHVDLLRYLVGDFAADGLRIEVQPDKRAVIEKYLREQGIETDDFLVGVHIGGRGEKRWPVGNYQKLADWITDSFDAKLIFIWGPEEKKVIRQVRATDKRQVVSQMFDLPTLSALIGRCNLFVSPDTGAMHLSVAVGTPTLALFIDSDPIKFGPQGKTHRIIEATAGTLSVETVEHVFREMIETQPPVKEKHRIKC
ncbi:MAG: glycosyltransferase family 9 protein [Candidatus Zixiibacteriota bacterium]